MARESYVGAGAVREGGVSVFVGAAPRLFGIGMRILRDAGDAEDVVQETWLRWARTNRDAVVSPPAFLTLTTTRLALNVSRSARRRREILAGALLPEPPGHVVGPETLVERRESVGAAIRLLMERLSPAERAVYLLRTAFDQPYPRIAGLLGLREPHTRQLLRRARTRLTGDRCLPVCAAAHRRLVHAFLGAADTLDLSALEALLVADAARVSAGQARPTVHGGT